MKYGLGLAIQRSPCEHRQHAQPKKYFQNVHEFGGKDNSLLMIND
jgi:hypothetical protein